MEHLELLAEALEYIEQHITEDIHTDDIANACYCSRSSLEKLFRFVNHISVRDYLIRRRMTKAARTLADDPTLSVLDVAVMYGYSSNEAFTRVFRQVWNQLPSECRTQPRIPELFPRMDLPLEQGDETMKTTFNISELYDLFQSRRDCFFVCGDIKNLIPINEISRKAGDLAILESMRRMEAAAGPDDIVFRIGGDEFVMLTAGSDEAQARAKVEQIAALNGQCFNYEGREIPLSLYLTAVRLNGHTIRYNELFAELYSAILSEKGI